MPPTDARPAGAARAPGERLRAGAEPVGTALAWLYLYSVAWLLAYAVLAVLVLGWKPVVITGGSMEPHIAAGDLVMVTDVDERLGAGTVVTYRQPGRDRLVTHRVVEALPEGYRTRGDANAVPDSDIVPDDAVHGAGRLLIPFLGRPLVWGQQGAVLHLSVWALASAAALAMVLRRPVDVDEDGVQQTAEPLAEPDPPVLAGRLRLGPAHG